MGLVAVYCLSVIVMRRESLEREKERDCEVL